MSPATQLKPALDERPLGQELPLSFANDFGEQDVSLGAKSCCSRPMRVRRSPSNCGFRVSDRRPSGRLAVNWNCAKPACLYHAFVSSNSR